MLIWFPAEIFTSKPIDGILEHKVPQNLGPQTAGLNVLNSRGQWPECLLEAAAQRLRHLRPGKRQA